jgi:hypothetical protein
MDATLKTSLWRQFGAAIDTRADAIKACPDSLWMANLWDDADDPRYGQFWHLAYHTLSWLNLYLTSSAEGFAPPPPFVRGALPETPYTKAQINTYLKHCRQKCQTVIQALTDEQAYRICRFSWMEPTFLELQLYCMRHVQEHAAHMHLFLGGQGVPVSDWISKARDQQE